MSYAYLLFFCNFDNSFHQCLPMPPVVRFPPDTEFQSLTGIAVVFKHDHAEHILWMRADKVSLTASRTDDPAVQICSG